MPDNALGTGNSKELTLVGDRQVKKKVTVQCDDYCEIGCPMGHRGKRDLVMLCMPGERF